MIYLATPYSHPDPEVREKRFQEVNKVAAKMINKGLVVFSPISLCHPLSKNNNLPGSWEFWQDYDLEFLKFSTRLIVLMQDGWRTSRGIQAEVTAAIDLGIPVDYMPMMGVH